MKTRSDDLQLLLSVVDCGGFSAAAESLGVQVARVSRAVSRIEQQLQTTLLNRTTRRVQLTEEGRQYVDSVRAGLQQLQLAEEALTGDERPPSGRLRVDAASPFAIHQLVPLVNEFSRQYPEISLELVSNEGFIDLLEHKVDVAFRIGRLENSSLHARLLGTSSLYLVASPDYLDQHGQPQQPDDLSQHQLIGFAGKTRLNEWPLTGNRMVEPTLVATNGEIVRQLALAGNGIACLSGFMVKQDLERGSLVRVLQQHHQAITEREQIRAVYYHSSGVSRRVTAFLDFIQPRLCL